MNAGWSSLPLGEVSVNLDSKRVPITKANREKGNVPYYGASGIVDHVKGYLFDEPLLLVSEDGANLLARTYPIAFSVSGKTWVNNHAHVLRFESAITQRFVELYLNSISLEPYVSGMAQPKLNQKKLSGIPIPLPPLEEQQRIVAVLDEAFEGLARARAHAEANLQNAQELFDNAVENELNAVGNDWLETTVGHICSRFEYGTSSKSKPEGAVPVLRMGNLQAGEVDWSDLVFTNDAGDINKHILKPNDVLFNRTNSLEHVGKSAIYRGEQEAIFAGYLIRLHWKPELVDPEYLTIYLNSKPVRDHGRTVSGKSVNQANISASKLKEYKIALPPLDHQRAVVKLLSDLRVKTCRLSVTYRTNLHDLEDLRRSLLQKAFAGELT